MIKGKSLRLVSAALVLCAAAALGAAAKQKDGGPKLTPEEERLVQGSRAAIVETGFSERYFDEHFEVVRVYNSPGDRRVVWRFRLNGYETTVNDSVGFYTDNRGRRVDSHMVSASLGRTRDIRKTIPFGRARRAMKDCIGDYSPGSILLQRFDADGRVSLVFTAVSLPPAGEPQTTPAPGGARPPGWKPAGGKKKKPFLGIGSIDLETGRCIKGVAQAGSPQANDPRPAPVPGTPE
jgi:hypothetical protein